MSALGWAIAAAAIAGILVRPYRIHEAWWAAAGAAALVLIGAIALPAALGALRRGTDVYLFLGGMMALAEFAKVEGIFAWVAGHAVRAAGPSRTRLFALVYAAGIVTTALLSNDATIVVLTPAIIAALRRYDASPLPFVTACALVANAASFVLPIANPSNLLVFADRMPPLGAWIAAFALPSLAAIGITFAVARWWFRRELRGNAVSVDEADGERPTPFAVGLLALAAATIVVTSARQGPLGLATFSCAAVAWCVTLVRDRAAATTIVREVAWPVIALTAALFVIIGAVDAAGGLAATHVVLEHCLHLASPWASLAAGFAVAAASNVVNNLPVGLNLGEALPAMHAPSALANAVLIGVNLGPNATVNGSLATILWLTIVRRAGLAVSPAAFARIGIAATIPALAAALAVASAPR